MLVPQHSCLSKCASSSRNLPVVKLKMQRRSLVQLYLSNGDGDGQIADDSVPKCGKGAKA
jgi:hypothetical protein